jgi:hypothetical protein
LASFATRALYRRSMMTTRILTHDRHHDPEQVRGCLEFIDQGRAETRARVPDYLKPRFDPITDKEFRTVMELALLGEIRRPFVLHVGATVARSFTHKGSIRCFDPPRPPKRARIAEMLKQFMRQRRFSRSHVLRLLTASAI